jgi:predicted DNA-binding WGR domain protein
MSRREFQFQEGTSHKFWAIDVDGPRFTVQFGRVGTAGQAQTKEFGSDAEARKAAEKLIAEKTRKGYAEVAPAASATSTAPAAKPRKEKVKEAGAPAPPAAPARPATLEVTRRVDVEPPGWLRRPGQPWTCRPRPAPAPFDLDDCLERVRRAVGTTMGWRIDWTKARISPALTPPEAHFWLEAITQYQRTDQKTEKWTAELAKGDYEKRLTEKQVVASLRDAKSYHAHSPEVVLPLSNLLPLPQLLDLILGRQSVKEGSNIPRVLRAGFREYVLPYLTAAEAESCRAAVRDCLDPKDTDGTWNAWCLAAYLGMNEELKPAVAGWADGSLSHYGYYHHDCWEIAPLLVFNLPDSALVESEARRLQVPLVFPDAVAAWLVHTQWRALDRVRDGVLAVTQKDLAERLTKVLAQVQAPEAAPYMLQLKLESKGPGPARQWLDDNPGNAIGGLIPVAAGTDKLAAAAVEYLREAKKKGHAAFIEEQLKSAPAAVADRVRQQVLEHEEKVYEPLDEKTTPRWLSDALAVAPAPGKLAGFAEPARLPPLLVGERRLNDAQVPAVLAALRASPLGSPHALVAALKQHADRASLDAFAWKLFELWLADGAPSKEKWAFLALGHLGGDAVALKLTPLVRAWPGESQHQRAVTGLECLRAIGTDTALIQLNGIAQRLKFKGLQNKAREFMEAIAQDRNMTRDELEDRIVPDLDLDERGTRVFDFGPRRFEVVLGPDLKPLVRDEDRKLREDLPKPGAKDDAAKASAAVADWKVLKKALREAVKVQAFRLEQSMVVGRRWTPEEFQTLLVRHPLMVNLVRRLLWGGYDARGKLGRTFRVTEEGEYADAEDRPCALDGLASVGVVHPLHLSDEERAKWGQVFGDYEIIAPFPQLGRPVLGLEGDEAKAKELTRFAGKKIPGVSVASNLEKLGWQRGPLHDHGDYYEHYKHFPSADVTAMTEYDEALWAHSIADPVKVGVKSCTFWAGRVVPDWLSRRDPKKALKLADVDPVVLSEVLADLTFLASKAE